MDELIMKEEISALRSNANTVTFEDVISGSEDLKLVSIINLKSGYSVGLTNELYPYFKIEHLSIHSSDEIDAATFDCIAYNVLGSDYVHIGSIYVNSVHHYLKLVSGSEEVFKDFIEFMNTNGGIRI